MKAAQQIFPETRLTPVLPPTAASTWASSVVGTWITGMPRMKIGRQESSDVADDAPAERDDHARPVAAGCDHLLGQGFEFGKAFARFAAGKEENLVFVIAYRARWRSSMELPTRRLW